MTRFKIVNDGTWGSAEGPRQFKVMTENQAGFEAYAEAAGQAATYAATCMANTITYLNSGRPGEMARAFMRILFLSRTATMKSDFSTVNSVLVCTLNGMNTSSFALKIRPHKNSYGYVVKPVARKSPVPKDWHNSVTNMRDGSTRIAGAIHLSAKLLNDADDRGRAAHTVIHEATHKYAGTEDYCYFSQQENGDPKPKTDFTLRERALRNADSFAWIAFAIGDTIATGGELF